MAEESQNSKTVLLIDEDDDRRKTRVAVLESAGYTVDLRRDVEAAEQLADEGTSDLVIIALRLDPERTASYCKQLAKENPGIPILILADHGVSAAEGLTCSSVEAGQPMKSMTRVASMLSGSSYVRVIK